MFIGHAAAGFAAKKWAPRAPLAWLLVAPWLLDLLWPVFLLAGIERVRPQPSVSPFLNLEFVAYPWSHSLLMAIVLIYLLLVVNFQSWLDPFIIISALPGALAGVVWALHLTLTTTSVPALMGAIMSLGVATANSVLVVSFARDNLRQGIDPLNAAWEAGASRLRPVLMTAMAMIIGMLPMALGLGEGGEQNAPLGRAVIGGLLLATLATLFFVPVVFSLLHRRAPIVTEERSVILPTAGLSSAGAGV